ncbi:hypothetical protein ACHQM5_025283 [Ranunculus cassubicifolius]
MLKTISQLRNLSQLRHPNSLSGISSNTLQSSLYPYSSSRHQTPIDQVYNNNFIYNKDPNRPPKLFVVQPRYRFEHVLKAKLSEALNLANSLEEQRDGYFMGDINDKGLPKHIVVQNPGVGSSKRHSDTYFGPGTVETVKCHLNAVEEKDEVDAVYVNSVLSGIQQRNLEREWEKPVLDRVGLIIEIFNAHAQTKEGKLQAELAALMYKRTRLIRLKGPGGKLSFGAGGESEVVSARGRGSGGQGFVSGAGETELQLQRRRIIERRNHLLTQIKEVRRTRALQRASRRRRGGSDGQGLATVAIVGYTNAGKSTLVNALSESDLYSDDRLFATVDPRVRSVILPSGKKVLLSDTVGFISDLPVQLVDAFHATLEEVVEADLLVHVIDSSAADLEDQRSSVLQVLEQIGVSKEKLQDMIEVWNKIDLRDGAEDSLNDAEYEEADFTEAESEEADITEAENKEECLTEVENEEGSLSETEDPIEEEEEEEERTAVDDEEEEEEDDLENWKAVDDSSMCKREVDHKEVSDSQDGVKVETSAVMGVGLQELLTLIDEKLNKHNVVERHDTSTFNRKWRPPRDAVAEACVE